PGPGVAVSFTLKQSASCRTIDFLTICNRVTRSLQFADPERNKHHWLSVPAPNLAVMKSARRSERAGWAKCIARAIPDWAVMSQSKYCLLRSRQTRKG